MDVHAALGRFSYTASSGSKDINTWHLRWETRTFTASKTFDKSSSEPPDREYVV